MKLIQVKEIKGKIILKTGLHIGAGDTEMRIGGTDNTVIKHPHTLEPYIPGSSLKGKVRSLLELRSGLMLDTEGEPITAEILKKLKKKRENESEKSKIIEDQIKEAEMILKLFGTSGADVEEAESFGPTRVSFSDCYIDDSWKKDAIEQNLPFTEIKPENTIDRIKGTAKNPRFTERVPAGVEFRFSISLKKMDGDDESLEDFLLLGLKLLQMDALGGNGSRGDGKVKFKFDDSEFQQKFNNINPFF